MDMIDKQYKYLLLDLDGTITDSMEGITRSVQYALGHFGIDVTDLNSLRPFIGPPLKDSFRDFYGFTDEKAEAALSKYREYFATKGLFENRVYEGMDAFLASQLNKDRKLYVATSKPEVFARQILEHFKLDGYFTYIGGSTLDGSRSSKTDVIRYVMDVNGLNDNQAVVMIGDRKHDMVGAGNNGIDAIGVLYGYGDEEELRSAGASYIAASVEDLEAMFT